MSYKLDEIKIILNETAKSLAFDLTQKEEEDLLKMFESIQGTLAMIENFAVPANIEASNFPDNQRFYTTLREDEPMDLGLHATDIFANTKEFKDGLVVLNNGKK